MITILSPGIMSSVQDAGRPGWRNTGVGSAGAMDLRALRFGNLLIGNAPDAAGIEITLGGLSLRFERDTTFALTGADLQASLDGEPVPAWWVRRARAGQVLVTKVAQRGMRAMLTVQGGIDLPLLMGSRSTDLKGRFGGYDGRLLAAGDRLARFDLDTPDLGERGFGLDAARLGLLPAQDETRVRFVPAAEWAGYPEAARAEFTRTAWKLLPDSNRMGYRLSGPELRRDAPIELLSHGIIPGTIQLPPSGQPVIQMNDANTCGGYPKLGVVITPDLPLLGQVRLGAAIRFEAIDRAEGVAARALSELSEQRIAARIALARDYSKRSLAYV